MALAGSSAIESDTASQLLVAESVLNDIAIVQATRKGKRREDAPKDDEEIAFDLQATSLNAFIGVLRDYQFASSIDRAIESDIPQLRRLALVDQAERDDHQSAVALDSGLDLPSQTISQRRMEQSVKLPRPPSPPLMQSEHAYASNATEAGIRAIDSRLRNIHINNKVSESTKIWRPKATVEKGLECVVCMDEVAASRSFKAPCGHYHCRDCIVNLVETSLRDETLHPLRCCQRPLSLWSGVFRFIPVSLQSQFLAKNREYSVPAGSRVYCSDPRCSTFLGTSESEGGKNYFNCTQCDAITCSQCKEKAHPGKHCAEQQSMHALQELASANKWQTCPSCHAIVELIQGCYHITCRCSAQFCYLCSAKWKTCTCRAWDDRMLLNDAERRVRNEFGRRAAEAQPAVYAQRVQRRMEILREDHECRDHRWMYRSGAGQCEECHDFLRMYLMRCIRCQVLVCRRCSVNRL